MDDHDWLDHRLAAGKYLPDDGFTARVMERLPARRTRSITQRQVILALAVSVAAVLVIVQTGSLLRALQQFTAGQSITGLVSAIGYYAHGSFLPIGAALVMSVLALGSIWIFRRWI